MLIELAFYTTEGCHLCEEAEVLLQHLLAQHPERFQIEIIDIVESEELIQLYGTRIPVLSQIEVKKELGWPFDYAQLLAFLELR
jgi:thiol-disulfide isomerase/thioredoxin